MNIEKEVRYVIDGEQIGKIIKITNPYKEKFESLDITFGKEGFESLSKFGYICRIRQKGKNIVLEIKKRISNTKDWLEQEIKIESVNEGYNFYTLMGLTPYLYLKRKREIRKYKDLKIFIDEFDILGNFVEVEYQDSKHYKTELNEFLNKVNIKGTDQPLYGDIVKKKLEDDTNFRNEFNKELQNVLASL